MLDLRKYLIDNYEGVPVRNKPAEISIPCPSCGKGNFHFSFNVLKRKGGCFKCGWNTPTAETLVSKLEGISKERAETFVVCGDLDATRGDTVLKILESNPEEIIPEEKEEHHVNAELPTEFIPVVNYNRNPAVLMPQVLQNRQYKLSTIVQLKIGFCQEGYYASRLIFPLECDGMKSFFARRIFDWMEQKYKNPPGSKHSQILYNYDNIPIGVPQLFVVEGCTDVCRMIDRGYHAVGTSGKKISASQIELISKRQPQEVIALFDGDAIKQNIKMFEKLGYRVPASYAILPKRNNPSLHGDFYYDPDNVPQEVLNVILKNRVSMSKIDSILRVLNPF